MLAAQLSQEMPPLILDVRSPEEYAAGHIPGAINIEYSQLSEQIETLRSYEAEEIVIYCERGFRANRAIATLETAEKIARETAKGEAGKEAKFSTTVLFLKGHMRAWRRANLPIEKSSL
ncbi:MAG: rhodanese-like domain-containing protein [Cyanobacteria bacterium J06631_9]